MLDLSLPYQDDLSARINDAAFRAQAGLGIVQKLNLIRKMGNTAVHDAKPIPSHAALIVLRELHHVVLWAAYHYSTNPQAVPLKSDFDPVQAAKAAPSSRAEVAKLAAKFAAQDAALATERAEKTALTEELAVLREQIKAAQAANRPDDRDYSEAATRDAFIDVLLGEAGWPLTEARDREFEVTGMPGGGSGFVGYVLWGADGLPLAVVKANAAPGDAA